MTLFKLLAAFIRRRPVTWGFYAVVLAIAVSVTASVLLLEQAASDRLKRDLGGIDLVIGAKGSPLQLVMSAVFQVDAPTGNIALSKAERFAANPLVRQAIPLSMGDSVGGLRIVGKPVFSVQHHPEASPGPQDSHYLFRRFVNLLRERQGEAALAER